MDITAHYTSLKKYLLATAYNMTGQVHEAEDIVQEAFEDVLRKKSDDMKNAKSYLTRMVINKSIDRLAVLKRQREQYPGVWLPEPYITELENAQQEDILPYVFLYLMEQLNPVERAVFILRESFNYPYEEIASICEITIENCRQILHRAKEKMKVTAPTESKSAQPNQELLAEFLKACLTNDTTRLTELLKEDVLLYSDGGGKVAAARKVVEGISNVATFLQGVIRKTFEKWSRARQVVVNNECGLQVPDDNGTYLVLIPATEGGKMSRLFIMRNPEKIFFK